MTFKRNGFSIVELMVAIFILSSCLLLILGLFTFLFNSTQKGIDLTAGTAAGEMIMEEFLYPYETGVLEFGSSVKPVNTFKLKEVNGVTFRCDIEVSPPVFNNLRKVDATIYWWVTPGGTAGYGSRKYMIKEGGKYKEVNTGPGFVAEYGSIKTKITKFVFIPPTE